MADGKKKKPISKCPFEKALENTAKLKFSEGKVIQELENAREKLESVSAAYRAANFHLSSSYSSDKVYIARLKSEVWRLEVELGLAQRRVGLAEKLARVAEAKILREARGRVE